MSNNDRLSVVVGQIVEEQLELTVGELCRACDVQAEWITLLVDEGVLEPVGRDMQEWRFPGSSLQRTRIIARLQRDLGVNLAGAALVLELMDEIDTLRTRQRALQGRD